MIAAFHSPDWKIAAPPRNQLDVVDSTSVREFFEGRQVDLLVCAAGMISDSLLIRTEETVWDDIVAVNFHGAATCAKIVLPGMIQRRVGHIVFISSWSALHPPAGQSAYATAKAALLGLTRDLSRNYGKHKIRVNAILPGFLETRMTSPVTEFRKKEILEDHHLGSFNTPDAVGKFIHFLHHQLPHTSGQVFQLDSRTEE